MEALKISEPPWAMPILKPTEIGDRSVPFLPNTTQQIINALNRDIFRNTPPSRATRNLVVSRLRTPQRAPRLQKRHA
ncbi:MAG: hypothetical protein VBE63_20860 [Lamprobacter sp.]|uniref:hypothetical protein n=1 Tax=Lamprobacter sp. TaxID=3100796 RepID=UPI002B2580CB|nr:hypothetical protein [Lamprobacter sp.]MEA3642370.1 hypothetical protein [Lamprobacter sp.]